MPNEIKYADKMSTATSVLNDELNSLADGSRTDAGDEYGNGVTLNTMARLELSVTFPTAPDAGGGVELYMLNANNDSNYTDGSSTVAPSVNDFVAFIDVRASTGAQRIASKPFRLNPAKTKFILVNKTGQAFPSSGSNVYLYAWNEEIQ